MDNRSNSVEEIASQDDGKKANNIVLKIGMLGDSQIGIYDSYHLISSMNGYRLWYETS